MARLIDLRGREFERLVVVRRAKSVKSGSVYWECRCVCGGVCVVQAGNLVSSHTRSCGCLMRERAAESSRKHGMFGTPEYASWAKLRARCNDPKDSGYARYGGRGITACSEWDSFEQFFKDIGPRPSPQHSIDRINNDGNYEPANCRWATAKEQSRNRRSSRYIEIDGACFTLAEWAEKAGVNYGTAWDRLDRGWSAKRALGFE